MTLIHWDDVEGVELSESIGGRRQRLADAAGSVGVGAHRVLLGPGQLLTPPHAHTAEEEIFHVLSGSATLWLGGRTCVVAAGDTIVHAAGGPAHTLIGGDGGLEVLVFGQRLRAETAHLPRTGVSWLGGRGVRVEAAHPWEAEAVLGVPAGEPGDRPANVVNLADLEGQYGGVLKSPGWEAGARKSGLNRVALPPDDEGAPPHCHTAEEEVFVVLEGEGTLELWGRPRPGGPLPTEPEEAFPIRRGHVVARPPGSGISHGFRSGASGLTFLAYGTREPSDLCYYPRWNKIFFRGLGLIARLEPLAYSDGEPA